MRAAACRISSRLTNSSTMSASKFPIGIAPLRLRSEFFQPREQAGGVPAPPAHALDLGIELIDQRRQRQRGAVAARFGEADGEVLAHPFHREAVLELAGQHGLVAEWMRK